MARGDDTSGRDTVDDERTTGPGSAAALTAEQRASFAERGWLRLCEAFPRAAALQLQERLWDELREVHGIVRERRETFHQPRATLRCAKRDPLQHVIASEVLLGAIGELLDALPWRVPSNWGIVLTTFPDRTSAAWDVPASGWHYDFDLLENAPAPRGLQVFTFLGSVVARGGGTLVVEGSHRLAARFVESLSADDRTLDHQTLRRRFLRHDPWLRALTGREPATGDRVAQLMGSRHVRDGSALRVVELTGEPGDAILCHPLLLHVASRNAAEQPRFMRSQRICCERSPSGPAQVDRAALRTRR
ncbi:phytanoyl-CoA dioxygenase family protein [Candidatus Binatia bacterium]|nr:phytanoyl-CoA dioxygenase family protein [Candidatus Binatia bacterium]